MPCNTKEREQTERFSEIYRYAQTPVIREIELHTCGCDYGATSWSTLDEAMVISELLGLRPGLDLLDIGSGSGWPGVWFASTSGCSVTLLDLPYPALQIAAQRATDDEVGDLCQFTQGDAANLPLADASFDLVSHTDVLCCLDNKAGVLGSCRRVIRREGRMVFTVISVAPGLSAENHRRAVDNGPPFIESERSYPVLLEQTGWEINRCIDVTAGFTDVCRVLIDEEDSRRDALVELYSEQEVNEKAQSRNAKCEALSDGLLRREIFVVSALH
jgi:SAM-dependent methyltransferase